jgi:hypothetical protein
MNDIYKPKSTGILSNSKFEFYEITKTLKEDTKIPKKL